MVHIDCCGPAYDLCTYRRRLSKGGDYLQGLEDEEYPVYVWLFARATQKATTQNTQKASHMALFNQEMCV